MLRVLFNQNILKSNAELDHFMYFIEKYFLIIVHRGIRIYIYIISVTILPPLPPKKVKLKRMA